MFTKLTSSAGQPIWLNCQRVELIEASNAGYSKVWFHAESGGKSFILVEGDLDSIAAQIRNSV